MRLIRECIKQKGMHDIHHSLDMQKLEQAKTLSSLAQVEKTTKPKINEKVLELALRKERDRFKRQDQSLGRSLTRIAKQRTILMGKKVTNQRIMALRKQLQVERYAKEEEITPKPEQVPKDRRKFKTMKWGAS